VSSGTPSAPLDGNSRRWYFSPPPGKPGVERE
jgi:hypothetical protein